jgi:hypothetical protein
MYIHRGIIIYYYISIEIAIIPLENEPYLIYFDLTFGADCKLICFIYIYQGQGTCCAKFNCCYKYGCFVLINCNIAISIQHLQGKIVAICVTFYWLFFLFNVDFKIAQLYKLS